MKTLILSLATLGVLAALAVASQAGEHGGAGCCASCGCQCECAKTCHLVCGTKKVTVVCYGCKCEDFCIGGPSCKGCLHDDGCCDCGCKEKCGCDCDCNHRPDCHLIWREWCPSECACQHTKKILTKYEVVKEIPSFKWVVEPLCASCAQKASEHPIPPGAPPMPGAPVPPAPKSAALNQADAVSMR